jgi:hypothetical protein
MGYLEQTMLDEVRIPCAKVCCEFEDQVEEEMRMIRLKVQNIRERLNNVTEGLVARKRNRCIRHPSSTMLISS